MVLKTKPLIEVSMAIPSSQGFGWSTKKLQFISQDNLVLHTLILFYKQRFISNDFLIGLFLKNKIDNGLVFFQKIKQHWAT